jgi:hypothetical protein
VCVLVEDHFDALAVLHPREATAHPSKLVARLAEDLDVIQAPRDFVNRLAQLRLDEGLAQQVKDAMESQRHTPRQLAGQVTRIQRQIGELPSVRADASRCEQIGSRTLQVGTPGRAPPRLTVGGEEADGSARLTDQAGAVAADPDFSMRSHEGVEAADGMMAVDSARLDVDVIHAQDCDRKTASAQAAFR